jgi:hypothetical protein
MPFASGVGAAAVAWRAASEVPRPPERRSQSSLSVLMQPDSASALAPSTRVARSLDPVLVMMSRLIFRPPGLARLFRL